MPGRAAHSSVRGDWSEAPPIRLKLQSMATCHSPWSSLHAQCCGCAAHHSRIPYRSNLNERYSKSLSLTSSNSHGSSGASSRPRKRSSVDTFTARRQSDGLLRPNASRTHRCRSPSPACPSRACPSAAARASPSSSSWSLERATPRATRRAQRLRRPPRSLERRASSAGAAPWTTHADAPPRMGPAPSGLARGRPRRDPPAPPSR